VSLIGTGIPSDAIVVLDRSSLEFSDQIVRTASEPKSVTLTNTGAEVLTISSIELDDPDFTLAPASDCPLSPATLAQNASCTISVTFAPTDFGVLRGAVVVRHDAAGSPEIIGLVGTGIGQLLIVEVSPTRLRFGDHVVGTTSAPQTVTLTNAAGPPLTISGFDVSPEFAQTNTCPVETPLDAPNSCTISLTFTPAQIGARTGTLSINSDSSASPHEVSLTGTGVSAAVANLDPSSLEFSDQLVGTASEPKTVTLTNTGAANLVISSIDLDDPDFTLAPASDCPLSPATLAVNASCTISVTFAPTVPGVLRAAVVVRHDAAGSPEIIGMVGTGIAQIVDLAPTRLRFADQVVATTSAPQTVTLTNSAGGPLTITGIDVSPEFAQTNTCPAPLPASLATGNSCSISVTFAPAQTGTRTGTLSISSDSSVSPHEVSLTGTGVSTAAVNLDPSSLEFSDQLVGTASEPKTVTLTNTGTATLVISSIDLDDPDFTLAPASDCPLSPATLAVGASCSISVTFTPTAPGELRGAVVVRHDAAGSPEIIGMVGTGGVDFSIEVPSGSSTTATITAGQTATFNLEISPSGFSGEVSLSCTGAPQGATCTVSPSSVTLDGSTPVGITVTVTTAARSLVAPRILRLLPPGAVVGLEHTVLLLAIWLLALGVLARLVAAARRRPAWASLTAPLLFVLLLAGGGGGGGVPTAPSVPTGTPAGTHNLTLTATSGNLSKTITLTLTVN
jgi:hypothetical protein